MENEKFSNAKILLVDDDTSYLSMTKMFLEDSGMSVHTIDNPIMALEYVKEINVDIILLDYFMPQATGEEFLKELRKFNTESLVILQTGFAEKKPPIEMLQDLDIQGYHDKTKGIEELLLLTLSAIKTVNLIKTNKEQEKKINMLQYRNEFFGKFLYRLLGEIAERSFSIRGNVEAIKLDETLSEDNKRFIKHIEESIHRLGEIAEALKIEEISVLSIEQIKKIIENLFAITFTMKNINFQMNYEDGKDLVNCDPKIIMYILVELIEFLIDKQVIQINIECKKEDSYTLSIKGDFSEEIINKVKEIATKSEESIRIEIENTDILNILIKNIYQ